MMQIEQCRTLGRQSLRISGSKEGREGGDFREQMLIHNRVEGILPFEIINENGMRIYEYPVAGLETVKSLCARKKLKAAELRNIMGALLGSVCYGHEFMLLEDDYVITPETVYTDGEERTETAYYSGYGKPLRGQLRSFSEFLMDNIDYKDDAAVLMIYSFYMKTKEESCTIEDLIGIVSEIRVPEKEREKLPEAKAAEPVKPAEPIKTVEHVRPAEPVKTAGHVRPAEERASEYADNAAFKEIGREPGIPVPTRLDILKAAPLSLIVTSVLLPAAAVLVLIVLLKTGLLIDPDTLKPYVSGTFLCIAAAGVLTMAVERMLWGRFAHAVKESYRTAAETEDEATLLLCEDGKARYPFALVSDDYPAICVSRFPFFVGKDANTADYVLNKAGVSRYHMKIDKEDDGYVISDLASTNGTFINGIRIEAYKPEHVRRGDEIRIGPCIFYCN